MGSRPEPVAFVSEDTDFDELDRPVALATFSAHVEADGLPDGMRSGPRGVPADEALAWAREHAELVHVRYCAPEGEPGELSGGARQPDWPDAPYPVWPPAGLDLRRRRLPGWEHLDQEPGDPPIAWTLRADVFGGDAEPERIAATLAGEDGLSVVDWAPGGADGQLGRFRLDLSAAATVAEAEARGEAAVRRALAGQATDDIEVSAYPAGSEAAAWNASIHAGEDDEDD